VNGHDDDNNNMKENMQNDREHARQQMKAEYIWHMDALH